MVEWSAVKPPGSDFLRDTAGASGYRRDLTRGALRRVSIGIKSGPWIGICGIQKGHPISMIFASGQVAPINLA
jgi:hypothetical protein